MDMYRFAIGTIALLVTTVVVLATPGCDAAPTGVDASEEEADGSPYDIATLWQMALEGRAPMLEPSPSPYIKRLPNGGWIQVGLEPSGTGETDYFGEGSRQYRSTEDELRGRGSVGDTVAGAVVSGLWSSERDGGSAEDPVQRYWSSESMAATSRAVLVAAPTFVLVPEVMEEAMRSHTGETGGRQRHVAEAEFLADGRVVLLYRVSRGDSVLLHFLDLANGDDRKVAAPRGVGGEALDWSRASMVSGNRGVVVVGGNPVFGGDTESVRARTQRIWHVNHEGRFLRPPSSVGFGEVFGVSPDGSVVMWQLGLTATTAVHTAEAWDPVEDGVGQFGAYQPRTVFSIAVPRDTVTGVGRGDAHDATRTAAVVGERIWIVPTERPELMALDDAGRVTLKVEWDAGDRDIPSGVGRRWSGVERFPAAAGLIVGADGLVYVQRWTLDNERPVRDPEWLGFSQAGELARRVHIPSHLSVLAIDHGLVVVWARNREGLQEVRVHGLASDLN